MGNNLFMDDNNIFLIIVLIIGGEFNCVVELYLKKTQKMLSFSHFHSSISIICLLQSLCLYLFFFLNVTLKKAI